MKKNCSGKNCISENLEQSDKILLVGAGNLATSLGVALASSGVPPVAVWSRSQESAGLLGDRIGCPAFCDIDALPPADIVIISVSDSAIEEVAAAVATRYPDAIIAHTAGSVAMEALHRAGAVNYGVFYPMQTFSKRRVTDFSKLTVFVEGCSERVVERLEKLARLLTGNVVRATSLQRRYLHVAAVFACNFANAAYCMAAELLAKNGLPFEAMLPLIDETAAKVHSIAPLEAQTGPARRGDTAVMECHLSMLDGELKDVYALVSDYISTAAAKNKKQEL